MPVTPEMLRQEPLLAQLLKLLAALPRFDPQRPAKALQGELAGVREAENLYHQFNRKYQVREYQRGKLVTYRDPLLLALFELPDWENFQRLLTHSTVGRDRKRRSNKKRRQRIKHQDPEQWLDGCREKRAARLHEWEAANHPRLLQAMATAEQATDEVARKRFRCLVLNELEAKFVDQHRAEHEYYLLGWRVLLGIFTQTRSGQTLQKLRKLAERLWEHPDEELKAWLARNLEPIQAWATIEDEALDDSDLLASGEIP